MSILVVDDAADTRELIAHILHDAGYGDVIQASSGESAQELIEAKDSQIGLVLLDVDLPALNGLELCRRLRADRRLKNLPVIMVTAMQDEQTLAQSFAAGATDFLGKPVRPMELLARVKSALRLKRERERRATREHRLVFLTHQDPLTGIGNRRHFQTLYGNEWRRAARAEDPLALIMIDVDHFHAYNEALGHLAGDHALRQVAQAIDGALHRAGDFVARYGGEEFVVVLPHTDLDGALLVAEDLRQRVERLAMPHPASQRVGAAAVVTVSLGVASVLPQGKLEAEALIASADEALFRAKRQGRNRVVGGAPPGNSSSPTVAREH